MFLVRKKVPIATLESHHEVAGFIYAVVGVIYAVVLAFAVLVVWEQFNVAEEKLEVETASISSVYRHSQGVQDTAFKSEIKSLCYKYVTTMIEYEFPAMEKMQTSIENRLAYHRLWEYFHKYQPENEHDKFWFESTVDALGDLQINRRLRILTINFGVPGYIWFSLVLGGIITIGFAYLFGTNRFLPHLIMIIALSGIIGIALLLVNALENPFSGIIRVDAVPLEELLKLVS
jgi:hypothetical protein